MLLGLKFGGGGGIKCPGGGGGGIDGLIIPLGPIPTGGLPIVTGGGTNTGIPLSS